MYCSRILGLMHSLWNLETGSSHFTYSHFAYSFHQLRKNLCQFTYSTNNKILKSMLEFNNHWCAPHATALQKYHPEGPNDCWTRFASNFVKNAKIIHLLAYPIAKSCWIVYDGVVVKVVCNCFNSNVFISLTWCLSPSGPSCHQLPSFNLCQSLFFNS